MSDVTHFYKIYNRNHVCGIYVSMNIHMIMKKGVEASARLLPIVTLGGWDREGDCEFLSLSIII